MSHENNQQCTVEIENKPPIAEDEVAESGNQINKEELTSNLDIPMNNIFLEDKNCEEDLDYNVAASSRPPVEPFELDDHSEDDYSDDNRSYEELDICKIPGMDKFRKAKTGDHPHAHFLLQYIDTNFFKFRPVYEEAGKSSTDANNHHEFDDPQCSFLRDLKD